tara:strand:- start:73 stop:894 length:822 start_codon:yes stop_codon:yes gene_type:complete
MNIMVKYFDVLCIKNNNSDAEIVQSLLSRHCLGSFLEDNITNLYFEGGAKSTIEKKIVDIIDSLKFDYYWDKQNKENWHLAWQDNFKPVIVNKKLAIIPHWQEKSNKKNVIKIKPGMAFGTGHHETTWLVLNKMMRYIKSDTTILDCGAGSGILSIAAKKLGAKKIDSVEFDLECRSNFFENLEINGIKEGVNYHHSDILSWKFFNYDLILANINKNILKQLIPRLEASDSLIILSGLLHSDCSFMEDLIIESGFQILNITKKGEWACLVIKK